MITDWKRAGGALKLGPSAQKLHDSLKDMQGDMLSQEQQELLRTSEKEIDAALEYPINGVCC